MPSRTLGKEGGLDDRCRHVAVTVMCHDSPHTSVSRREGETLVLEDVQYIFQVYRCLRDAQRLMSEGRIGGLVSSGG